MRCVGNQSDFWTCTYLRWGNGMVVGKNSKDSNLLSTTSDGLTTGLELTSISTTKIITCKGMISKHVPPLIGLMSLVVPTSCSLC